MICLLSMGRCLWVASMSVASFAYFLVCANLSAVSARQEASFSNKITFFYPRQLVLLSPEHIFIELGGHISLWFYACGGKGPETNLLAETFMTKIFPVLANLLAKM